MNIYQLRGFKYNNPLGSAINSYIRSENDRRKFINEPEIVITGEVYDIFYDTITVYEECIKDFFLYYGIDTAFLDNTVKFTIEQFPWIFNYVFYNGIHAISMEVSINYNKMIVTFHTLKCKYTEGNVIFVNSIPDKHLRKLNLNKLPITTMVEYEIPSDKRGFKESTLYFSLKYEIYSHLYDKLNKFNTFIDTNIPGLRKLLIE